MKTIPFSAEREDSKLDEEAAKWIIRCETTPDATESREFKAWLKTSQAHRKAYERQLHTWSMLDSLSQEAPAGDRTPNPDLLIKHRTKRQKAIRLILQIGLPAAAALVLGLFLFSPANEKTAVRPTPIAAEALQPCERRLLTDGSEIILKRGTKIEVLLTQEARRVKLLSGEVHVQVAKDPKRPFYVKAAGVEARAVGTEFNVRLGEQEVFVLVSEGKVQVTHSPAANPKQSQKTLLSAGDAASIPAETAEHKGSVRHLPLSEMAEHQAWEPKMLSFEEVCLSEIVQSFNRANEVKLHIEDPSLGAMKLTANLRSDNVAGFLRLLEAGFSVHSRQIGDARLLLERTSSGNTDVTIPAGR